MDEFEEVVFGADVVLVECPGFSVIQAHNAPRPVGEPLEHLVAPSPSGPGRQLKSCSSLPHASPRGAKGAVCPATPEANARRASERAAYSVQISQRRAAGMRCAAGQPTELPL